MSIGWISRCCAIAAASLTLASCDAERLFFDPARGIQTGLAVSFSESPIAAAQSALSPADRVQIKLARADAVVLDTIIPFPVSQTEMRVQLEVPVQGESESLTLTVELQEGKRVLSRGVSEVTLQGGKANAAEVVTNPLFEGVTVGERHTCHVAASGEAYCWGNNGSGQLGAGNEIGSSTPVPVQGGLRFASLDATGFNTCGLTAEGKAYCWGSNGFGQLGDGSNMQRSIPTTVAGGLSFVALGTGHSFTCGLANGGEAYCWGSNRHGTLGTGTSETGATTPQKVAGGLSFTSLSSALFHSCALTKEGKAYCWGMNGYGQLGDGSNTNRNAPVAVSGDLTFTSLATGTVHTCGITTDKDAYCWGARFLHWGQLGNGSQTASNVPVRVEGGLKFVSLTAGQGNNIFDGQTCGLTVDGVAYCWGNNEHGQLGASTSATCTVGNWGPLSCSTTPVAVSGGITFDRINATGQVTCGVSRGGDTYCWGRGQSGQLGSGALKDAGTPTKVLPSAGPVSVASVSVTPGKVTLNAAGDTVWLNGTAKDQNGRPIPSGFRWTSTDSTIAGVNAGGLVTARAAGTATVTVALDGKSASTSITVGSSINNYSMQSLGALNGLPTFPMAIDRYGNVAGYTQDGGRRGFYWSNGMTDVGTLGGSRTFIYGMNDFRNLVGESTLPGDTVGVAVMWNGFSRTFTRLPDLPSHSGGEALDINRTNVVVGLSEGVGADGFPLERAVRWINDAVEDLGFDGWGGGINDRGVIVGSRLVGADLGQVETPIVWENGQLRTLPVLEAGQESEAIALNENGEIVGFSSRLVNGESQAHPVLWRNGQLIDLSQTGERDGAAIDINETGQVVGYVERPSGTDILEYGFVWNRGERRLLNDVISDKSWHVAYATAINDGGVIAAFGCQGTTCGAVLLRPILTPPTSASASYSVQPYGDRVSRQALRSLQGISPGVPGSMAVDDRGRRRFAPNVVK